MLKQDYKIGSGCIGVCKVIGQGTCSGCGRTMPQIANWLTMTEQERRDVHTNIANNDKLFHMITTSSRRLLEGHED